MKILHIEMGRQLDGAARQVANLLNGFEKFPIEHTLVCATGAEIVGAISNRSVKISRIKLSDEKGMKFVASLRKIIRYEKPDFLHIHSRPGDGLAAWAGRRERKPMVYSIREDARPGLLTRHLKFPLFSQIIAQSQSIRRALLEAHVSADLVTPIPCSVDSERFKPSKETRESFLTEFGLRGDGPVLAMVAQWIPDKGHTVLFSALPLVLAKYPTARLLVFGRGPLKDGFARELSRRNLEKYVRLEGFRTDLEHILPNIDILIHPVFSEGLGVSLLEAAACGVPIIASRVGVIPEIVQDRFNGYLVKPGDSQTLARHIDALLEDREQLLQFGHTGRELMVENFSIARMVASHREIYRHV